MTCNEYNYILHIRDEFSENQIYEIFESFLKKYLVSRYTYQPVLKFEMQIKLHDAIMNFKFKYGIVNNFEEDFEQASALSQEDFDHNANGEH